MKICFECESNKAVLLIAFYDIITVEIPDDSIPAQDYFGWIIDELGERANQYISCIEDTSGPEEVGSGLREFAALYNGRKEK